MASEGSDTLAKVVQEYYEVADAVNHLEIERFINEIKSKWDP